MIVSEKGLAARKRNAQLAGRPVGSIEDTTAYKKAFNKYVLECVMKDKEAIIKAMIKKAKEGDVTAFTALRDTAVGKPAQALEVGGTDGQPIVFMPLALIQKHSLQIDDNVSTKEPVNVTNDVITAQHSPDKV